MTAFKCFCDKKNNNVGDKLQANFRPHASLAHGQGVPECNTHAAVTCHRLHESWRLATNQEKKRICKKSYNIFLLNKKTSPLSFLGTLTSVKKVNPKSRYNSKHSAKQNGASCKHSLTSEVKSLPPFCPVIMH